MYFSNIYIFFLLFVVIVLGARASVTGEDMLEYRALVAYASSLTETLLFIHYLAIVLIEIRHLQPVYYIKVIFLQILYFF